MSYNQAEKMEIIRLVEESPISIRKTLLEIGLPRSTFYKWYKLYKEGGYEGLADNYKMPNKIWNKIPDEERNKITDIALDHPEKSCREVACLVTDKHEYFVSESSVYRILREKGVIPEPVFAIQTAADTFDNPTKRVNEMWQMDFTYFKVIHWGWYYLLTVLDDYSRFIVGWRLCKRMKTEDVTATLDIAVKNTGVIEIPECRRPRILSDNGSAFKSKELKDYIEYQGMWQIHGSPYHPETQGKIERYHRSMKNIILLDNYYSPLELESRIRQWVNYYNFERYHESLDNIIPVDKYYGREEEIFARRQIIKAKTMKERRLRNKIVA